jgi:hypothetical protein
MVRNKKIIIGVIAIAIITIFGIILLVNSSLNNSQKNPIQPVSGEYLSFLNGSSSKIFLIDSHARYDVYDINMSMIDPMATLIKKGDACVIINASIRNDYDKDYWLVVIAQLYNTTGDEVGRVTQIYAAWKPFEQIHAKLNETNTFDIYVKYDKKDVESYDLFLDFMLLDAPMP